MNSKEEKKNVLKPQVVYVKEDFYNEIINGFNQQKQKEQADYQRMPIILNSVQRRRIRAVIPFALGSLFKSKMLHDVVESNFKIAKKKKISLIRDSFVTSWYDLDYWFKKIHDEDERLDAQDKGNIIVRFWRGLKAFAEFSRLFQSIKQIRHNDGSRRLFSRSYDLTNALDFHQFETNLNWTLQGVQQSLCPVIVKWMQPTMTQLRVTFDTGMQKLWDRFFWHIVRGVTIGNNWLDIFLNAAMWAVTIASWAVAGYTGGVSALATASMWGAKIAKAIHTVTKPLRTALKAKGVFKAVGAARKVTRVFNSSRIARGLQKGANFLRGHKMMMKARSARVASFAKRVRGARRAIKKKWYVRWVAKPMITLGAWATMLYGFDQQFIDLAQKQIYKRTRLMWRKVQAKYLMKAKMMGQTVVDLSGMISKSAQKIKAGLMEKPKRLDLQHLRTRTQQLHGMKAVPLDQKQFNNNPLIDGLLRLRLGFQSLLDLMEESFGGSKRQLFYWNLAYNYKGADRWTFSMGAGKVGFALYNDGKRFGAQYLTKSDEQKLDGYTRRIVDKKLQHIYFYDNGYNKMIDSYYIMGKYKQLRTILAVPEKPSEQELKKMENKQTDANDLSGMQGMTIVKEMTLGEMRNGIIDNMIVKLGKVLNGQLTPLKGSVFHGFTTALKGATVAWRFFHKEDGSYFDIKMSESSDVVAKKDGMLGKDGSSIKILTLEKEICNFMMFASIRFLQAIYPPSPQTLAARTELLNQYAATAKQLHETPDTSGVSSFMVSFTNQEMQQRTKELAEMQKEKQALKILYKEAQAIKLGADLALAAALAIAVVGATAAAAAIIAATLGFGTVAAAIAYAAFYGAASAIAYAVHSNQMSKYNTMMNEHNTRNDANNARYEAMNKTLHSRGSRTFEDAAKG